jgi:hypothetical protein
MNDGDNNNGKTASEETPVEESYSLDELTKMNETRPVTANDDVVEKILVEEGLKNSPTKPEATTPDPAKKQSTYYTTSKPFTDRLPFVKVDKTKDEDTLVNIHVNNPLKKVIALLEEIKKEKAFSFTLKGSLGVMGVILALSFLGIFGSGQVLCEKGLQTRTGTIKILQLTEEATDPSIPWTKAMLQKLFFITPTTLRQRAVIIPFNNDPPIHLNTLIKHKLEDLNGTSVVVTGNYNSCSSTLTLRDEKSIEKL